MRGERVSPAVRRAAKTAVLLSLATAAIAEGPAPPAWTGDRHVRIGGPAPAIAARTASGSVVAPEDLIGRTVLLTFWSLADEKHRRDTDRLAEVRREFAAEPGLLMVSVQVVRGVGSDDDDWTAFLDERGEVTYPDRPLVRFDSDPRWWPVIETGGEETDAGVREAWGVRETPRSFLVSPDGTVAAADLPVRGLRRTLRRYFAERAGHGGGRPGDVEPGDSPAETSGDGEGPD